MEHLTIQEMPDLKKPPLVMAFAGWPDAGEAATGAIKYLVRKLPARKFAELNPEEFYDFSQTRPRTVLVGPGQRIVRWPANEFFYWKGEEPPGELLLLVGVEPNLKWKTFASTIAGMAEQCGSAMVIHLGALLDAIPHTRETRLTGSSNKPELRKTLDDMGIRSSNYQGPTGITSAITEACNLKGLSYASMWGHTPHYLQASPNYKVSYSLLRALHQLLGVPVELAELRSAAATFEAEVEKAVSKDAQISAYVQRLEEHYDQTFKPSGEIPSPGEVVKELEEFLKEQQRKRDEGQSPQE